MNCPAAEKPLELELYPKDNPGRSRVSSVVWGDRELLTASLRRRLCGVEGIRRGRTTVERSPGVGNARANSEGSQGKQIPHSRQRL